MSSADVEVVTTKVPGSALGGRRVQLPDFGIEIGPLGHLAQERTRLNALEFEHFDIVRLGATIGAELVGVDLRNELGDEVIAEIRQALVDFKVIFFRDQPLDAAQHVAFARRFGDLEIHPFIEGNPEHPELVRFEKGVETGGYENGWHHDVTWREIPSMGAILRAVKVPSSGGDTLFSDMAAAYDGLDDDTKSRIDSLTAVHDYVQAFGHAVPEQRRSEMREEYPLVEHPVVRTHPESGRKLIYVNPYFTSSIVGMDLDEGRALIRFLSSQAALVEYQCRWHWTDDSVAFWDNRVVQHYAASDYWPDIRVMERASIVGDRPV